MKRLFAILLLPGLLFCFSCKKENADAHGPEHQNTLPTEPGQLKVMSFNIRQMTTETNSFDHWAVRAGACRDMVIDQQPSIIGLQELAKTQWDYMYGTLNAYGYEGLALVDYKNSILYKKDVLQLLDTGIFWLSDTPDVSSISWDNYERYVRWAVVRVIATGTTFFFINTHLGLTTASRDSAMKLIKKRLPKVNPSNLPVVFLADFNTHETDAVFDIIRGTMVSTREVAPITDQVKTYNGWNLPKNTPYVCDHIWITNGIQCSEYRTVTKAYDGHTLISDHFPVYAIIKF